MDRYKIIRKGLFQNLKSFEEQLNSLAAEGWTVVGPGAEGNQLVVVLERTRWYGEEGICFTRRWKNAKGNWALGQRWVQKCQRSDRMDAESAAQVCKTITQERRLSIKKGDSGWESPFSFNKMLLSLERHFVWYRQALSSFGSSTRQYLTTVFGAHALSKTVLILSFLDWRLKCPFHTICL